MLNPQELPIIEDIANQVYNKIKTRLTYEGEDIANNVPEYIAYRLLHAIEWASPKPEYSKYIALHLMEEGYAYPIGTSGIVRKYFDLPY